MTSYAFMFASALLAATIIPAQSEAVLVAFLLLGEHSTVLMLIAASAGNVLGSIINYALGHYAQSFSDRRWFPVSEPTLEKASRAYHRYGRWSLLLSWAPIIGDPLTVAAGVLREPFWSFLVLVTLAKVGRYLVLAAITLNLF
ncbi:MAG: YqaA family protein [Hyphomicrobiales bacterium]